MKKLFFLILIVSILFSSCRKTIDYEIIYYVSIQNNTIFNTNMQLIKINNNEILSNYSSPYNSLIAVDTVIYHQSNFGKPGGLIQGEGFAFSPYWASNSVKLKYVFEDKKETILQSAYGSTCDTTENALFLCPYAERIFDTIVLDKKNIQLIEKITYFVTEQQRFNAE